MDCIGKLIELLMLVLILIIISLIIFAFESIFFSAITMSFLLVFGIICSISFVHSRDISKFLTMFSGIVKFVSEVIESIHDYFEENKLLLEHLFSDSLKLHNFLGRSKKIKLLLDQLFDRISQFLEKKQIAIIS